MLKTLNEKLSERVNFHKQSYVPVFKVDCTGKPYHYGTMCAVTIGDFSALVTASHVLARDKDNKCDVDNSLFVFNNGNIRQLPTCDSATIPIEMSEDFLDLSVLIPRGWNVKDVVPEPIMESQFRKRSLHSKLYAAACGFPVSKNKNNGSQLQNRPYGYFGLVSNDVATTRAGYNSQFYFSFQIDLKRAHRNNQHGVKAPDPYGVSGGPVFIVHDFSDLSFQKAEFAGITVAKDKLKKHIICVRGSFVFALVQELKRRSGIPFNVLAAPM